MRLIQIYITIGVILYIGAEAKNHLDGIMQLHRVMRLEPKQTVKRPVKQEENQKLVVRKRGDQHVKHKNSTRREQRQFVWPVNEQQQHQQQQQYAQMLQQNQHLLYDIQQYNQNQQQQYGLFQPVGEQQQADLIQGQYQQQVNQGHVEPENYDAGQQYLADLLQKYELQARLNYYLQEEQKEQQDRSNQEAANQPVYKSDSNGVVHHPRRPTMPVYHYSPLPKGTFKEEREQRGEKFEASTKSVPIKVAAARPVDSNDYNAGLQHYRNEHTDNSAAWNNEEDSGEYDFGYRVSDHVNGLEMGKVETKENGLTKGSYHVLLPDGRLQVVNYWSDHTGYHTDIRYISRPH